MSIKVVNLTLRAAWANWYVLDGGSNWASVEGTIEEWQAISKGLREGTPVHHRRCAMWFSEDGKSIFLNSPRNASGERDRIEIKREDATYLALLIEDGLAKEIKEREERAKVAQEQVEFWADKISKEPGEVEAHLHAFRKQVLQTANAEE